MFDDILGGSLKNLNVEGVHSAPSLGQRLGSMLGGEPLPEEEPVVGGPNLKAGPQTGESSSLRMKQHESTREVGRSCEDSDHPQHRARSWDASSASDAVVEAGLLLKW